MECFLTWLEKYKLLIELIITVLTITLSLVALYQTKRIAKQQAELQERQIKISIYENKNEINKALNMVFDLASKISRLFEYPIIESFEQEKLYDLLNRFVEKIDYENIAYILEQSRFFLDSETYINIRMVCISFSSISISIDCLGLLKPNDEDKAELIEDLRKSCAEIKELQDSIKAAMIQELKIS